MWNLKHNCVFNCILIATGLEKRFRNSRNPYLSFRIDNSKSIQENAGYSKRAEIDEVLAKSKSDLTDCVCDRVETGGSIFDIGCGPGMYLSMFAERFELTALDINAEMVRMARQQVPNATFHVGDFLESNIPGRFDFVYCIGVLVYVPRVDLRRMFDKVHELLVPGGTFYLNYPHAISLGDVFYRDLTYIQYSPNVVQRAARRLFEVELHEHGFDGRRIAMYDRAPYVSLNSQTTKTYKNSSRLVCRKR